MEPEPLKYTLKNLSKYLLITAALLCVPKAMASTFKTSDDVTIDYEIIGEGFSLVMLHSGTMSRDDMGAQIECFSKYYQVIALDSREQGRSSGASAQITYELMSNDVTASPSNLKIQCFWSE